MFEKKGRAEKAEGGDRIPGFLRTHPHSSDRCAPSWRAGRQAGRTGSRGAGSAAMSTPPHAAIANATAALTALISALFSPVLLCAAASARQGQGDSEDAALGRGLVRV